MKIGLLFTFLMSSVFSWEIFGEIFQVAQKPIMREVVQYQFEDGKGLKTLGIEDIVMGVGMIEGIREVYLDKEKSDFTGTLSFEMLYKKSDVRIEVKKVRFIEFTGGKDGRIFEPTKIFDRAARRGKPTTLEFLEEEKPFPFVWEPGDSRYIYMTYEGIPANVSQGDLVVTFQAEFPTKKHPLYYENRFSLKRTTYKRNNR